MKYKKYFPKFVKLLDAKMLKGFREYGDVSFERQPKDLSEEIQQELIDICGWSMIMWVRLEKIKKKL
jgi:hypothetical protein